MALNMFSLKDLKIGDILVAKELYLLPIHRDYQLLIEAAPITHIDYQKAAIAITVPYTQAGRERQLIKWYDIEEVGSLFSVKPKEHEIPF